MKLFLVPVIAATIFTGSSASVTFYGWPDNSPPGGAISMPVIHKTAGGTGTYGDPITFAADPKAFPKGTKIYLPSLKKYFISEDNCVDCQKDAKKGKIHIDLWMNSNGSFKKQVLACENKWTPDGKVNVTINPSPTLTVDTTPLFNTTTGVCL